MMDWISEEIRNCPSCYISDHDVHIDICFAHEKQFQIDVENYFANKFKDKGLDPVHPQIQEWISVEERLPAIGEECIIFMPNSGTAPYSLAYLMKNKKWECWGVCESIDKEMEDVTHWMPLPKPPEGKC